MKYFSPPTEDAFFNEKRTGERPAERDSGPLAQGSVGPLCTGPSLINHVGCRARQSVAARSVFSLIICPLISYVGCRARQSVASHRAFSLIVYVDSLIMWDDRRAPVGRRSLLPFAVFTH